MRSFSTPSHAQTLASNVVTPAAGLAVVLLSTSRYDTVVAAVCVEDSVSADDADFTSAMAAWVTALTVSVNLSNIWPASLSAVASILVLCSNCASSKATERVASLATCERPGNSDIHIREQASVLGSIGSSGWMSCTASRQSRASSMVCIFSITLVASRGGGGATSSLSVDLVGLGLGLLSPFGFLWV